MDNIKTKKILAHLKNHKTITSWEAFELFNVTRLSSIIYNLRKRGYDITDNWKEHQNQGGRKVRYVEYLYNEQEN